MNLPEMQEFLTNQGVVRGIRVSDTNANDLAKAFGGTTLLSPVQPYPAEIVGIRVPTLYGNLDVQVDEYLLRESNTGRLSSMTEQEFKQTYFVDADPGLIAKAVAEGNRVHREAEERLEAMRNHPSSYPNPIRGFYRNEDGVAIETDTVGGDRDLWAERQKNINGDTD